MDTTGIQFVNGYEIFLKHDFSSFCQQGILFRIS